MIPDKQEPGMRMAVFTTGKQQQQTKQLPPHTHTHTKKKTKKHNTHCKKKEQLKFKVKSVIKEKPFLTNHEAPGWLNQLSV